MNDPIPIRIEKNDEPQYTAEEYLRYLKERNERRIQWFFLGLVGLVLAGFLTPLIVFLTRLALGG